MTLGKLVSASMRSIFRNKMRSFLTSLGIIIGVCSVIVMVAVGSGSQAQIHKQIAAMGTNLLMVMPPRGPRTANRLTLADVQKLRAESTLHKRDHGGGPDREHERRRGRLLLDDDRLRSRARLYRHQGLAHAVRRILQRQGSDEPQQDGGARDDGRGQALPRPGPHRQVHPHRDDALHCRGSPLEQGLERDGLRPGRRRDGAPRYGAQPPHGGRAHQLDRDERGERGPDGRRPGRGDEHPARVAQARRRRRRRLRRDEPVADHPDRLADGPDPDGPPRGDSGRVPRSSAGSAS